MEGGWDEHTQDSACPLMPTYTRKTGPAHTYPHTNAHARAPTRPRPRTHAYCARARAHEPNPPIHTPPHSPPTHAHAHVHARTHARTPPHPLTRALSHTHAHTHTAGSRGPLLCPPPRLGPLPARLLGPLLLLVTRPLSISIPLSTGLNPLHHCLSVYMSACLPPSLSISIPLSRLFPLKFLLSLFSSSLLSQTFILSLSLFSFSLHSLQPKTEHPTHSCSLSLS